MDITMLEKAVNIGQMTGYVFLATADYNGQPNIAIVPEISIFPEGRIALRKWFCPTTIDNIKKNNRVSCVIWDSKNDKGYQLQGRANDIEDMAMMDGYSPKEEMHCHYPQVERQLIIEVSEIFNFKRIVRCNKEESICP